MEIKNTLVQLYNTLSLISVKGEDVKTMAACLQCVEQLVQEIDKEKVAEQLPFLY